jgi:hypothetical protein
VGQRLLGQRAISVVKGQAQWGEQDIRGSQLR